MAIGIVRIVLTLIPAFDDHVGSQIQYEAGTIAEVLDQEFVEPVVIDDFRKCAKFCVCQVLEGGGRNLSPLVL